MKVPINLDADFEKELKKLSKKYGENMMILNGLHESQLNFSEFIDNFIDHDVADVTIDQNANANGNKDIRSFISEKTKGIDKLFAFNKIFYEMKKEYGLDTAKTWLDAELGNLIYTHDAPSCTFVPYCYNYDVDRLAKEGLFFLPDYNHQPPEHLGTFVSDVIEFTSFACNRTSGAVGLGNLLIYLTYFWKKDVEKGYFIKDPIYYLKQNMEHLIYRLNQPFLRVDQSSFTNMSVFDASYLENLCSTIIFPDGSFAINYADDVMEVQKIFLETVGGIREHNMFTFPVLSAMLLYDYETNEFVDKDFARWVSDYNTKWNDLNFFISGSTGVLSNCCRLLSDTSKVEKADGYVNSIGGSIGSGDSTEIGSTKVATINLMGIAYESEKDEEKYLKLLKDVVILDCKLLDRIRRILERNVEKGLLPNVQRGMVSMKRQFLTVGMLGLYEVIEYFGYIHTDEFGNVFYTDEGLAFAEKIFEVINTTKDEFAEDKNYSMNLESVPAERCAVVLAAKDALVYGGTKEIYSNQFIPLTAKTTLKEKLRVDGILCHKCGGGVISHINLESNFPNADMAWDMLNVVAQNNVIYSAFCTKIKECENHHGFVGDICGTCGSKKVIDTYQRIVGFLTPSRNYSKERKKEFSKRQWWNVNGDLSD